MPSVSVIVPNYNHARYLPQRIESILRQTYQDFELILLDDCSTDDSRAVLSQYASDPRVRLEFNQANAGTFKQWNKGVRLARGKYIWMAESDDYADKKFLECLVAALERDEKIAFAYCRSWRVMENGRIDGFIDPFYGVDPLWNSDFCVDGREHCRKFSVRSPVICNASAALFRKSAYETAGGADESLRLCGDWKVWAAMALVGKVAYVNQPLNYFRHHLSTVRTTTARDATDVMEKLKVIRWILDKSDPSPSDIWHGRQAAAHQWVPAVMSLRIPWSTKLAILKGARKIDPYPISRLAHPIWLTIQHKVARHWRSRRPAPAPGS
jgi:glycosyltransferase involved in cell wall biosynthesis